MQSELGSGPVADALVSGTEAKASMGEESDQPWDGCCAVSSWPLLGIFLSYNLGWLTHTVGWVAGEHEYADTTHTRAHTHVSLYLAISWRWSRKSAQQAGTGQCRGTQLLGHQPAAAFPSRVRKPGRVVLLGSSSHPVLAFPQQSL